MKGHSNGILPSSPLVTSEIHSLSLLGSCHFAITASQFFDGLWGEINRYLQTNRSPAPNHNRQCDLNFNVVKYGQGKSQFGKNYSKMNFL